MDKRELIAAGKIGLGTARVVSGVLTGLGKGLVGTYCRNHHMMRTGMWIARQSCEGGKKMVEEGLRELKG